MKFVVDEMPYFDSDCPFHDTYHRTCELQGGAHCSRYDVEARQRSLEECDMLVSISKFIGDSDAEGQSSTDSTL